MTQATNPQLADGKAEARILVVDDEADIAMLVADALREADPAWAVETVTDPIDAVDRVASESYDCVITDLVMPGLDGLNLAEKVHEANAETALIAISGRATLDESIEAMRLGFADFIRKPFDLDQVRRAVCRTLRRRQRQVTMEQRFAELAQSNARLEANRADLSEKLEIAGHDLVLSNKRMARQLDELVEANDVARALMGIVELEDLLGLCSELVADRVSAQTSSIALYEPSEAAVGLLVRAYPQSDETPVLCWLRQPVTNGVMIRAAQSGRSVHVADVATSNLLEAQEQGFWHDGRLLVVPIEHQGRVTALAVLHREPDMLDFETEDIKRVASLTSLMGPAIASACRHHRQRCQTYASLETVAREVQDRLPYFTGHAERVLAYGQHIGQELGLSHAKMGALQIGARLHDVGHIVVPVEAIDHPGPLTDEQWEQVRRHPEAGRQIVEPLDFFGEVGEVIRCHHEAYDGTGYPDRRAGDEIPIVARVLSVADAFDAMTSTRPYRDTLTVKAAAEKIAHLAGQQFDPHVADVFLQLPQEDVEGISGCHRD